MRKKGIFVSPSLINNNQFPFYSFTFYFLAKKSKRWCFVPAALFQNLTGLPSAFCWCQHNSRGFICQDLTRAPSSAGWADRPSIIAIMKVSESDILFAWKKKQICLPSLFFTFSLANQASSSLKIETKRIQLFVPLFRLVMICVFIYTAYHICMCPCVYLAIRSELSWIISSFTC